MSNPRSSSPKRPVFRGDLEGIRGIFLLVIMATHLVEWPTGGMIGLDVFFVLSGFLITGLLVKEFRKTGKIDLAAFYRRRIRRLAPASFLAIVVTVGVGFLLFPEPRAISTAWDAFWALLFVANWNFALGGTDYFATELPQSPLLHFWSLGVEEQFYLVWPLLILGTLLLGARSVRRGGVRLRWTVLVVSLAALVSFVWSVYQSTAEPEIAYLSTLTRVWQLALGGLLAFSVPFWSRMPALLRPILAWGGFAVLLATAYLFTPEMAYPGWAAFVPSVATGLVIVSGIGGANHLVILSNPVARYLGKLSYSGYLWHWPVYVYLAAAFGEQSRLYLVVGPALSLGLAALSYHFVENPIRHSSWLEPKSFGLRDRWRQAGGRRVVAIVAAVVAPIVAVSAVLVVSQRTSAEAGSPQATSSGAPSIAVQDESEILASVEAGLSLDAWPETLSPTRDDVASGVTLEQFVAQPCLFTIDEEVMRECTFGDPALPETAVLLGDSTSLAWVPGLQPALERMGYRLVVLTLGQCPFAEIPVLGTTTGESNPEIAQACVEHRQWAAGQVAAIDPSLVIATDGDLEPSLAADPIADGALRSVWGEALQRSLDDIVTPERDVVLLTPAPGAYDLEGCFTLVATPADCTVSLNPDWQGMYLASDDVASASDGNVHAVETLDWFCLDGRCPVVIGDNLVRMDSQHVTIEYAQTLSSLLEQEIRTAVET